MDNNTNKKPNKVNMPKFNLNWLYMIIAMMLLGLYLTNESGTATKNISYDEFQQYVRDGYISKVITTNLVYQSPELLSRPYYTSSATTTIPWKLTSNPST